jgi:hypothetical protein
MNYDKTALAEDTCGGWNHPELLEPSRTILELFE